MNFVRGVIIALYSLTIVASQYTNNEQFQESNHAEAESVRQDETKQTETTTEDEVKKNNTHDPVPSELINIDDIKDNEINITTKISTDLLTKVTILDRVYKVLTIPITKIMSVPKVNDVVRNIGTCIVNGAMELITYYLPAPLLPLITSAAGLFIPFEPIMMLRKRMPVNSYRRAFSSAFSTFLGAFNRYKVDTDDPYMSKSFNRRFMGNSDEIKNSDNKEN